MSIVGENKNAIKKTNSTKELGFKQAFIDRYSLLTDWDAFALSCTRYLRRSIRVNTLKISVSELHERLNKDWILTPIPWCAQGFWVEHRAGRRDLGNTLEHQLGYYYIQEAASMIPPLALNPTRDSLGIDLCAAPGSKTSQLAALMENSGCIIANDYRGDRLAPLGMNLLRSGVLNTVITLHQGERFKRFENMFDWVLCDAPCSGTGTISKSWKTISIWNPHMITKLATQQKGLLEAAYAACKPGGTIVYSTCSLEPEENEGVVDHFLRKNPEAKVEKIELLTLKTSPAVLSFDGADYDHQLEHALRIWPQDNDTEGFFVCKILKKSPSAHF